MRKREPFFKLILLSVIFGIIVFGSFCSKKPSEESSKGMDGVVEAGIDVQKIKDTTGLSFDIVKTKDIGYEPLHKFYWVNSEKKLSEEEIEVLAKEIIDAVIENKPRTYHSFTIHFLQEDKAGASREKPKAFAKATFLPEGSWSKVGRIPINDYCGYELTCSMKDNVLE